MDELTIVSDVAVVGAGPAGIVCALELARAGCRVCLVESGTDRFHAEIQTLGDLDHSDYRRHAPMHLCTRRQLGGASVIWGGRCVPYDPVDFDKRDYIPHSDWPLCYADVQPYYQATCNYLFCGKAVFNTVGLPEISQKTIVPGVDDGEVRSSDLERWSLPANFWKEYRGHLRQHHNIDLQSGLTCVRLSTTPNGRHVCGALARTSDGRTAKLVARVFVVACGALETTRLLLCSNHHHGGLGNASGLLGRFYMGHISGNIARVHFTTDPKRTHFGFLRDRDGIYLRPRFTFSREYQHRARLTNIAAWLVNPTIGDPTHGNGVLSFAYLALSSPCGRLFAPEAIRQSAIKLSSRSSFWRHARNMLHDLPRTAAFVPTFGVRRFLCRRKIPGLFQYSTSNTYDLHYHGEQVPNGDSHVTLADRTDAMGVPRLNVDLRYSDQDVDCVIRAHHRLDVYLRKSGVGWLEYLPGDRTQSVWDQASDGYHQVGTTRMSSSPNDGVVDPNCRVHGIDNLYVASSSTFVTSGQANSTFMIVAFAIRIAEHVARALRVDRLPLVNATG